MASSMEMPALPHFLVPEETAMIELRGPFCGDIS
jgi:hypothetical protein